MASVKYAGFLSSPILIFRGTWKGHPLSPALFILALEPLAMALLDNHDIYLVFLMQATITRQIYADDALLVLTNGITALPNLQAIWDHFSATSGLHINLSKTTALNITLPDDLVTHLQKQFPYHWVPHSIDYLGIKLTSSYSTLFTANYYLLLRSLTFFLHPW